MRPINAPTLKAYVGTDVSLIVMDVIEFEGGLWLVTEWLDNKAQGWTTPARIIRMDTIPHQLAHPSDSVDFVVNISIPIALLQGHDPSAIETECALDVRDLPGIRFSASTH